MFYLCAVASLTPKAINTVPLTLLNQVNADWFFIAQPDKRPEKYPIEPFTKNVNIAKTNPNISNDHKFFWPVGTN